MTYVSYKEVRIIDKEPPKRRADLKLAKVSLSNKQRRLVERNEAMHHHLVQQGLESPYVLSEKVLEHIILDGYRSNEILGEFRKRIAKYKG